MRSVRANDLVNEDDNTYTLDGALFSGTAHDYFPDGTVRSETQFVNGHQEGFAREWFENGKMKTEAEHLGDGYHGIVREWYPNGQLMKESIFEFGICLEEKVWTEDGRLRNEFHLQPSDWRYELLESKRSIWRKKDR